MKKVNNTKSTFAHLGLFLYGSFISLFNKNKGEKFLQNLYKTKEERSSFLESNLYELPLMRRIKFQVFKIKFSTEEENNFYRNALVKLADLDSTNELPVSGIDHKSVFMEQVFRKATEYVCIFDENLSIFNSQKVQNELKKFIKRKGILRIVVSNPIDILSEEMVIFHDYHETYPLQVFVTIGDLNVMQSWRALSTEGDLHYFTISDDKMYWRLETPEFDTGRICFNDTDRVAQLKEDFRLLCQN